MKTLTKDTFISLGLVASLLAVAAFVGAQNQKLDTVAADVAQMKPSLAEVQTDLAVIRAVLVPSVSVKSGDKLP